MKMNMKLATAMILFASVMMTPSFGDEPKPLIPICPTMTEEKLQTLADQGNVSFSDQTYNLVTHSETHNNYNGRLIETKEKLTDFIIDNENYQLIGRDRTNIFYQEKLLENDVQLNGFLKISKLFDRDLPAKAEERHIDLVPTPNFCAYEISLGENKQVIAISKLP